AGGLVAGDNQCMRAATSANLDGTWRAWVSVAATSALDHAIGAPGNVAGPWTLPDRATIVFANRAQLATGPSQPITRDARGDDAGSNIPVWTGTTAAGTPAETCADWTVDHAGVTGRAGRLGALGAAWTDDATITCGTYAYLYCFEQ